MRHPEPKYDPYNVDLGYYIGSNPFRAIAKHHNVNLTIIYTYADFFIHQRNTHYFKNSVIRMAEKYSYQAERKLRFDIIKAVEQIWKK